MKELLQEIKKDVLKYDFDSIDYYKIIDGIDWTFTIEKPSLHYSWFNDGYEFIGSVEIERFMELSIDDMIKLINSDMYYNTMESY